MPPLTPWLITTSLVYLPLSLLVGNLLAAQSLRAFTLPGYFPVYIHLLTFGWITLLIFGVVFWKSPKYSREKPRASESLGLLRLAKLGLLMRAVG
jgi:hypothetical protein